MIEINSKGEIRIDGEIWFTYKQIAFSHLVTPQTVYNWVNAGKLEAFKIDVFGITVYRFALGCDGN